MQKRGSVIGGLIMIGVGAIFLLLQMFPELASRLNMAQQWPLIIVVVGGVFLVAALLGTPPLAIPGSIITGIGGMLYYQNATGNWASWAFAWALIPGFVGIGLLLAGILAGGRDRVPMREGGRLLIISLVMFVVFGAFFNGFGGLGRFWPVLLIGAGIWMLLQRQRVSPPKQDATFKE
jgi:hypothetical protein